MIDTTVSARESTGRPLVDTVASVFLKRTRPRTVAFEDPELVARIDAIRGGVPFEHWVLWAVRRAATIERGLVIIEQPPADTGTHAQ